MSVKPSHMPIRDRRRCSRRWLAHRWTGDNVPGWWETTLYVVTGSVTFVMVFVIQHTQQRQTAATQRKLDELLRSSEHADSTFIAVEEASEGDLEALTRQHVAHHEQNQTTPE